MVKIVNQHQLQAVASHLATELPNHCFVLLSGPLGSGKTVFAKALLETLGVTQTVKSPSFIIMANYQVVNPQAKIQNINHFDFFRLMNDGSAVSNEINILANYFANSINVIEWPYKPQAFYAKYAHHVYNVLIEIISNNTRKITISKSHK